MNGKYERILSIYNRLMGGAVINKAREVERFQVTERSIRRDLEDIRSFLANEPERSRSLVYDRARNGYILQQRETDVLTSGELLTVCRILRGSDAVGSNDAARIINKLIKSCALQGEAGMLRRQLNL